MVDVYAMFFGRLFSGFIFGSNLDSLCNFWTFQSVLGIDLFLYV
jgi:hypothetical protein